MNNSWSGNEIGIYKFASYFFHIFYKTDSILKIIGLLIDSDVQNLATIDTMTTLRPELTLGSCRGVH